MESKSSRFILVSALCIFCLTAFGQNIKGHYISRSMSDGTLYHMMPITLFESNEHGNLSLDMTYKQNGDAVVLNFTYQMKQAAPADSVQFINGQTMISGVVNKIYIEPDQKVWKHRYSLSEKREKFSPFFGNKSVAQVIIYSSGKAYKYKVRKPAWADYAPIGFKIFEMIEFNEKVGRKTGM